MERKKGKGVKTEKTMLAKRVRKKELKQEQEKEKEKRRKESRWIWPQRRQCKERRSW